MKCIINPLVLLLLFFSVKITAQNCGSRYYDKIFTTQRTNGIQYGSNVKFNGDTVDLLMDIYEPANDTLSKRPMIMLAFGGSFTGGIRQSPDIVRLCNEFSERGYVCVSIDYRLGFENGNDSDTNQFKALIRGVQDMKGALRYFYKDAVTINEYKIDTQNIFAGGVSAGGFIGLNLAYGKTNIFSRPIPAWSFDALNEVGGVEGNSGNAGYSWKVKGVINLCGAITDTIWVQAGDPILVSVHGTADDLVPFYYDSVLAQTQVEAMLFGSGDIHRRANHVGVKNKLKALQGAEHVPFIIPSGGNISSVQRYMDTTIWTIRDFLYEEVICAPTSSVALQNNTEEIIFYPNPTDGLLNIQFAAAYKKPLTVKVFDFKNSLIFNKEINTIERQFILEEKLPQGPYIILLLDNETQSIIKKKTIIVQH